MIPRALTIAGSDSGGGAGIQADLKTFTAFRVFGMSAVTAVTAQNTRGVVRYAAMPARLVTAQIAAVLEDIGADAIKLGMLASPEIIRAVVRSIEKFRLRKIVLDPVMFSKNGCALLSKKAEPVLISELLPRALIVTPNAPEAERLSGVPVRDQRSARKAAQMIKALGPRYVLIKGGHFSGADSGDILYDGLEFRTFSSRRVRTGNTHGTGCTLAAAIAAGIARGEPVPAAVENAKAYLDGAIRNSFGLGKGHGPLNHFWRLS